MLRTVSKMMSLHHGWGWQPPQTASCIHIEHIQSLWAHWYAVHRHTVAALHSYQPYLAQIWGFWVTNVESKWCHHIMVEANSHLKLLSASILNICQVFEHIDMAVHRHTAAAVHSYTCTTWLRCWGSGSIVESKCYHYVMVEAHSHLKLLPASILDIYKVFEHIDMLSMGIQ
jgi:hypothetical protein